VQVIDGIGKRLGANRPAFPLSTWHLQHQCRRAERELCQRQRKSPIRKALATALGSAPPFVDLIANRMDPGASIHAYSPRPGTSRGSRPMPANRTAGASRLPEKEPTR
jgi:hypothetical protein